MDRRDRERERRRQIRRMTVAGLICIVGTAAVLWHLAALAGPPAGHPGGGTPRSIAPCPKAAPDPRGRCHRQRGRFVAQGA